MVPYEVVVWSHWCVHLMIYFKLLIHKNEYLCGKKTNRKCNCYYVFKSQIVQKIKCSGGTLSFRLLSSSKCLLLCLLSHTVELNSCVWNMGVCYCEANDVMWEDLFRQCCQYVWKSYKVQNFMSWRSMLLSFEEAHW